MQDKRLGLNPEQVVVLATRNELGKNYESFKQELLRHPQILNVTVSNPVLPTKSDKMPHLAPERPEPGDEPVYANTISVGIDFIETLDIPLVQGRTLRPEDLTLMRNREFTPVLINEATVKQYDWQDDPIGKEFACCFSPTPRVVGVVKDFHYQSLKDKIEPVVLRPTWWSRFVLVRVQTADVAGTLAFVEDQWQTFAPGYPFDYTFMDKRFVQIYDAEERLAQAFRVFSLLAVLIACLGLFGLAAFTAEQRTKEIGIRKVLGASVSSIALLLSTAA